MQKDLGCGSEIKNPFGGGGGYCLSRNMRQQITAVLGWERNSSHICLHKQPKE